MKSVEVIMVPAKDRQTSKEFYLRLGFKLIVEAPMGNGETWIQLGLPGGNASISLAAFHGIVCETDDIKKEIELLESKGVEVGKVDETPWGKFAWLKDPDGNSICLHEK